MKSLDQAVQKFKILKQKLKSISEQPNKSTKVYLNSTNHNNHSLMKPLYNTNIQLNKKISNLSKQQQKNNDKQNNLSLQNKIGVISKQQNHNKDKQIQKIKVRQKQKLSQRNKLKQPQLTIQNDYSFEVQDKNNLTKKKTQHKKNNSWNCGAVKSHSNKSNQLYPDGFEDKSILNNSFRVTSLNNSRNSDNFTLQLRNRQRTQRTLSEINSLLERKKQVLEAIEKKMGPNFLEESKLQKILGKSKKTIKAPNLFQMQVEGRKRSRSKPLTIRWS